MSSVLAVEGCDLLCNLIDLLGIEELSNINFLMEDIGVVHGPIQSVVA